MANQCQCDWGSQGHVLTTCWGNFMTTIARLLDLCTGNPQQQNSQCAILLTLRVRNPQQQNHQWAILLALCGKNPRIMWICHLSVICSYTIMQQSKIKYKISKFWLSQIFNISIYPVWSAARTLFCVMIKVLGTTLKGTTVLIWNIRITPKRKQIWVDSTPKCP